MIITEAQRQELLDAAKPLMKWLANNCHPHCHATVDAVRVELSEGVASESTTEFVKD